MQDYDAIAVEAEKRAFTYPYAGRTWTLRHQRDIDWRITRGGIGGDLEAVDKIFQHGMGAEQHAEWEKVDQPATVITAIFDDYLEFCGLSRGKSENSTDSSESTETPSRPASSPSTESTSPTSTPDGSPLADSSPS